MKNNTSNPTKPISKLKIGGEVKHVDQQFLQDNLDRFTEKYGNETVYVTNPDGQIGYIPIAQLSSALDEGYTLFDDAANIQIPASNSPKTKSQEPQVPHSPTPGEIAVEKTIGANTRNQIGHTFSTLNQGARSTMQDIAEQTANLPQVPKIPGQTNIEYAEAVAAATDKVMEDELERQQKQMQDLALPTTRAEIDKQLNEIDGELATLGQQRYGKLDANPSYGNPMLMGIDMNAHRRAKLYAENKDRIDELERERVALEAQKSMLKSIEKYQEYDRKGDKSGISNFFRAIKVGGDLQALASFGLTKMQEDLDFAQILERAHKGEKLVLDERKALQMYINLQEIAAMDRGAHFNAGLGMQQTFEFMRDIFLAGMTGGASAGNLIAQYGVKGAIKQLGKNTAKKAAEVYLKTALTPSFYKNLTSEIVDNYQLKYSGGDTFKADKKRSALSILYRTWAETGAEYFTETLSGLIGNVGIAKRIAKTARGKGMLSKAFRKFDEIHDRTKQNPIGGKILEGLSKVGVGNIPEELFEEIAVVPLQSITLGENRMGKLLDPQFYQEVLISTAAIGGMNSATNILVGGTTAAIEKRKTNNKIKELSTSLDESLRNSNETVQSAYDRFISNLENENFYDEEGVFAPESILDDLQALRDATKNDEAVMSQAEEYAKYHIFKQGQTEALRAIAEEELGPIEYGNSASVVPFLDMADGKTYHKLGETKDVVILGTNDKSIPGGKIVVPRSSLNGKELDPIPISEYVTDYFIHKPTPTKVETLDDISEIKQQGTTTAEPVISPEEPAPSADGVQHSGGVAAPGNVINVGDTAAYGEIVVKVVDIYENDDKKLEATIEDENGEQYIVSFGDLAPVAHQDNSTKTRYILPDGRRAVVQSSNGDNVTLGVLDDNNQVVEEIPSTMEEVLALDKVQAEEAEVIETAAAEMAAGGTETAQIGTDDLPRDKEGNIDYDALLTQSPTQFVEQMRSEFGTEVADVQMGKMVGNIDAKITELQEKVDKETSSNKMASMLREIRTLQGQRDAISTALAPAQQPVTTQESVPAAPAQAPEQIAQDATSAPNEETSAHSIQQDNNLFEYFAGSISELISHAKQSTNGLLKKVIAPISNRLSKDLKDKGLDITEDYRHVVDNSAIRHIFKQHGGQSEYNRGQIPIIEDDFNKIADIVENYDTISIETGKRGDVNIVYSKKYEDGTTIYVEEKRNKRKELAATSMWKKKNPTSPDANRTKTTPISDSSEVSENKDTTISETSSGVEEQNLTKPNNNLTETEPKHKKTILENAQDTVESAKIDAAAQEVNTEPTEAQKEAGNYKKGHYVLQGLNISIEQPKGSTRSGKDPDGKKWSVKMNNHYGYIRGTQGKDKDHIDVFIGDSPTSKKVFVVDQVGRDGSFDEHKVMIGFDSLEEARAAYLSNYEEGWQGLGAITETSMDGFKEWISDGTPKTRRFAEYAQGIPESYNERAAQWQKKLGIGITVYNSIDDIKDKSVQEQLRAGIGVSGWISRDDNGALKEIGIYLPYINSKADIDKTAIHEIVAHYGLKGLLGEDKYNELCDNVWELMRPYEQDQYLHYPGVNNARQAADEYIAHLAETLDPDTLSRSDKSIWEKIVEAVKNIFAPHKKTDVDLTDAISEADLSTLLRASYARLAENSGKKTQPKKPSKFKLEDAVLKEKNSTRPALTGIYHDSGYKVATDTKVLVALKEDYPKSAEGKVFVKGKPIPQSNFPKWQFLFNDKFEKSNIPVDFDKLIEKLSTIKKNEGKMPYDVSLKANDGQVYYYHPDKLMIFAKAAKEIGGELMMQRVDLGLSSESAKLIITSPRGKAIIMPIIHMGKIPDSVNIYDISFVDESTPVAQFVEKYETKENQTETKPKPKKTKEKPTASKEVSSTPSKGKVQDQKIKDFGEKIGGTRKDVARQRVRDAVNLTNVDLQKLADPDKILSRANIIKSLREGTMTKEDAITLMAMNNTVRCADSTEKYIMMPKYRDMALAWTNGQSPIFYITDKDIEDRFDQIGEHIKARMSDAQVEKHKQNIKKYYDILYGYYSDYIKTYRDLDYPNVERKLAGAIIRKFSHSDSFWVLKKADAHRGRTFRTMEAAIAYMEREYPVVVAKAKEDKTSADDSQKVGHLRVVKDSTGWFRIKSSEIPGEIYFSKSFSSRKGAEEYLQENRDMLIAKEQRAIDALMGSNIGMAERQGPDYRNGKDITSDEYLKAFGFRGVEFGNWVPQAERQMYLNKSYDAIMDICSILGISPKAFSLGGKLAIAFGARGHSKAMAHYESSKQVINLTRMKGVGSFAHEWFHAIDNYLARENSGNTMEFVTEKHPTKRQELYDAFNEFVSKMNTLDYTRRSRRAGDYWGSVIERAARMFESYIYTELGAKDISSPLLVDSHSVLSDEYLVDSDISSYPIPTAEETRQIKPYLDKIFSTIQEEVDADDNHILFRVAENVGSFEDTISNAKDKGYENLSAYPDVTNQMLEDALTSGRIMVYSKDPIAGGTTVSPSVQHASELSGPDAQIYSKDISIDQVAWETPDEGTYTTNDDIRFRFIGEQGAANLDRAEEATIRMDNLAVAREMETAGKDAKTIKIATGWERGADKKWRYEVDDDIEFDSPVDRLEMLKEEYASVVRDKDKIVRLLNMYPTKGRTEQQKEQIKQLDKKHKSLIAKTDALLDSIHDAERELSGMSLEELIGEDNNLFKEYPQLADINVSFIRNSRFGNYKGFYSPSENTIWISPDNGQPASTLVHELQHAIQHIEGFARGGNTSTGNELRDKAKAWSWKKQLEQTEKEHPELAGSIRLQATLEDEYKADGMEDKMPSKEIRTTGFNLYVRGYDNEGYESAYDQWEKIGLIDNPKDYSTYKRLAGEVEARNVQTRKWMPTSVRRETLAVDTEYNDVAREDQIFIMDGLTAANDINFRTVGLESLVERTYRKDGSFSFSGKNKIESTDDVAFIFKQLEDSAIENAFLVFVKEGKPTILHIGMGDISQTITDTSVVLPAYKDFGADKVYMVHNHPSGQLIASRADIDMLTTIQKQLPDTSVESIIINTYSGNYAVIREDEVKPILETQDTVELDVLSFSRNVFSPEYKSTIAERKISGPESIAAYLSAHRLGSGSKVGALLLNRSNVINGNLVTNSNEVSTENAQELAREIAEVANRCSANAVVLFGDFDYSNRAIAELQRQIPIVSGKSVTMLDVVRLNGKHTQSLHDMTLPSRSTLSDGVRFRVEQTKDRVENLFTAAISGSFRGKPIPIGNLTLEGKKYLESISGIKFKNKVDFVLNPSDLIHMYNEHYGDNEKDPGNNIPLTINDIRNIVDVILTPEKVIYLGEDEGKRFAFLAPAGNGAYNLIEIYTTKKGNLSSKTFYKTKKGVSHRAMILKKESKHSTSETNEATLSDAKVPILFDVANISENTVFRISDQNTLRDNLQAAITGYIVGTNTTGDIITTDDMVNTIYDYVENAGESSLKSNLVKELDAYKQNVQSGELNDGVISAEELLIENVHDIINMYSDEVMFRISNENQKVFISNAEQAVRNINMGKATAEQWLKTIEKAGGLKAGEDKWIGLSDWLKSKGKDTLTKDEVLQFIGDNRIIIQEQHYLEEIDYDADEQKQIDAMNEEFLALRSEAEEAGEWIHDAAEIAYMQMADKYGDDFYIAFGVYGAKLYVANIEAASTITGIAPRPEKLINGTRLDYTTNGLDDNKEIALIVPTVESWNRTDELHFGDAGDGRAIAWIRFGETTIQDPLTPEAVAADKARAEFIAEKKAKYGENYLSQLTEEEKEQFKPLLRFSSAYKQAAARKVLVIDEIQSKRHQEGREKGYKGDFALTKEKERLSAELDKKYERRGSLIRERENERDGEMYEIERINQALLEVRNNRDYDRLMAERDAITQKQQTRNDEILAIGSEIQELEKEFLELAHDIGFSIAIPDAPFEKNWHELAMKRMLRYAAENGFDKIAWTKGEQQADRYMIGNIVSSIMSYDTADGKSVIIRYKDNENTNLSINNNGQIIDGRGPMSYDMLNKNLSDVVGKEISKKILNGEGDDITYWDDKNDIPAKEISGEGLRVGGEGMKGFYDRMLPSFMNKYGKKWGVKVEDIFLPNLESNGITMHSVDVTPEMKESVMQGQVMFRAVPTTTAEDIDKNGFRSYLSEKDYNRMKKEILKGAPILRMSLYTPDEYISSVIDKLTQQSPSDATEALQMASSVRDAFTRAGIVLDMSDNEIIYALWKEVNPSDAVTIKEKLEHNHKSNDVRYRIDSSIGPNTNDIKLSRGEQFRENWVDKMVTVKMFQDLVKQRGGTVDDNLNPYITENLSLGRQQRENELFQENIYRPMVEQVTAVEKLFVKEGLASKEDAYKAVNDFLYARHAPERNRHVVIGEIEDYITRVITPTEMKFISGDNPRAEIRALATRIYNIYASKSPDLAEQFAKNMLITSYKSKDLNERLKEFRNKFIDTVKGAKEYTEKVFNSKRGTNRSGMSDKEAKEIIDKYYVKSTQAELDKLSDLVRESTHFTLDTWYKYNMISAKERDNYKSMYKYYIPLRNWEVSEDIDYSELTNQAFNHASEIISTNKKAHGRSSRADNPLAYIASLAQSAIVLGNKNQVRLNMYRLVLKNLNILGDIATIPKVYFVKNNATGEITQTTERPEQELFDQGLVETKTNKYYRWHKTGAEYQAHLIPVIINGDRHLIEMRGEFGVKIASAINNTNSVHLSYLDATRPVTQWLSATRTSYNPEFIPTNFARDFMFGNMAYAIEGGNILKLNRNLGRAFKAINRSELGTKNKDQYDRYYEEFMNEGAQTGFMNMRNIETMKKDLEKMHKQMLRAGGKLSDMKNFAIKYGSTGIQYLNAMSENAMRFAVYLTEREKGASAKQAAFAAKEITVNFNRKGRYTENMGALYSFFNASVQGTARLYDLAKKHRKRTAVALATLTTIKLASDLICVLAAGDDYDELSDYVKFSNILIPIGVQEDGRMKFLKIPMAQGVRAVTNIADVTVDVIRGTKTVAEAAKTFFLNNLGEHLPLSFEAIDLTGRDNMASFVTPFLPSVTVPFFEAWRNTDFKGDPIYREDFTLGSKEYLPRYTRAYNSTNPVYVELSRGLNALVGGNDELTSAIKVDENGNISRRWYGYALDINPAIVEHIIDGFMGGITTFPSNTIKTISSAISDEKEVELYNVPIVNRFVSVPTYKEGYDLYFRTSDLVRDIQASEKAVKAVGDMDAYSSIRSNGFNREITRIYQIYAKRVKYLKDLKENSNLSTQQMKDIEARMDQVMKEASAAFEKIYNKYDNNIE